MDRTLKEEAISSVSELNNLMNRISGMFLGLEATLNKVISTTERRTSRLYSEQLAPSLGAPRDFQPPVLQTSLPPSGVRTETACLIVKPADSNMSSDHVKALVRETVDPKALKLGINKMKNLSNNALLVECNNTTDRELLEIELNKIAAVSVERPKKKLPTLLLQYVPYNIADTEIKDTIIHQNNLDHIDEAVLNVRFTKTKFSDSRHIVIEVHPKLRREMLALQRIKLGWNMCRVEDFTIVTRCFKCLGYGHTSKFCTNQQACSNCAENHHWRDCNNQNSIRCPNCIKANTLIQNSGKKLNVNHSAFSKECPRLQRVLSIIISKTDY